jgi:chromate transporter
MTSENNEPFGERPGRLAEPDLLRHLDLHDLAVLDHEEDRPEADLAKETDDLQDDLLLFLRERRELLVGRGSIGHPRATIPYRRLVPGNGNVAEGPPATWALIRYLLGLGTWGFGGPIATVGYLQRDLVERRGWLERRDLIDGVALGQTMPGPLAAQVVMWIGFLQAGWLGALAAAGAFVLPSFVLVMAVAILYVRFEGLDLVQALFYGIAPAVMAIIGVAAVRLGGLTNGRDIRLWAVSLTTAVITAVTGTEIAVLFVAAGVVFLVWDGLLRPGASGASSVLPVVPLVPVQHTLLAVASTPETQLALAWFFLKAGALIFGSGLAIVPFLREGVVEQRHWLTDREFLDAVAIGLITPGPVVITAAFIGYVVAGPIGAAVSTIAIFLPIYLGVVLPGPWFVRHREDPWVRGFVAGATAAAAGAIAGATVVLTRGAIVDLPTAAIAAGALAFVVHWKNREPVLVLAAAVAGIAFFH